MDSASAVLPFELWEGQIPAAVTLCSDDVTALTTPDPIYVMIPRMGYLANVVNTVIECFQDSVTQYGSQNNVWFACEGQPLNWQLPAGVLYDMFCDSSAARDANLPWKLTVHFQAFPSEVLVPCSGDKAFEQHYFHSLKQGLYLEHGNSSTAMSLEVIV
jgi:autophagy-related protein 5